MAVRINTRVTGRDAKSQGRASVRDVAAWELRRVAGHRTNWTAGLAALLLFAGLIAFKHSWFLPVIDGGSLYLTVEGSTALGLLFETVGVLLLFFGMMLPFAATDAVAHDYGQRVHELVMAMPVSTSAYVWGRYLASLLISLGLAVLLLAALQVANLGLHAATPAYPAPDFRVVLLTWALTVLPATVLLSGLSFTLGTLLPQSANLIRLVLLVGWVMLTVVVDIGHGLGWFGYWTPTSNGILKVVPNEVARRYLAASRHAAHSPTLALQVQQQLPDLHAWVAPHVGLVLIGLLSVAYAAVSFQRFQRQMA